MTSDRFYVHKIRCDKKNSSLNSKWPFLYYLLTHKGWSNEKNEEDDDDDDDYWQIYLNIVKYCLDLSAKK